MRFPISKTIIDINTGAVIVGAVGTVRLAGTATAATIYAASSGGSAIASSQVTSNSRGEVEFWVDTVDYSTSSLFDIYVTATNYNPFTIDNLSVNMTKTPITYVENYLPAGYVTDGSVDYTTQIQSAITAGKEIVLPAGTFIISTTLNLRGYRHLRGMGRANTVLKADATNLTGFIIKCDESSTSDWFPYSRVSDLSLDGNSSTNCLGGIYAEFITRWEFERIEMYGFYKTTAIGLQLDHAYQVAIRDCYIRMGSTGAGKKGTACFQVGASTADAIHTTHITIDNCLAQYSGTGFFLSALGAVGDEFTIRQCASGNHDYGIRVQDNYRSVRIENTLIENTSINGIRITTATTLNIKGVTLEAIRLYENTIGVYTDQVEDLRIHQLQFKGDDAGGHTMFSLNNAQRITFGPYTNEGTAYDTVIAGGSIDPRVTNLAQNDVTPTVAVGGNRHTFITQNTNPTTITSFTNGVSGQEITIIFNDANTTIDFTGTTLKGNAGADFTGAAGDVMTGVYNGTNWYFQVHDNTP